MIGARNRRSDTRFNAGHGLRV